MHLTRADFQKGGSFDTAAMTKASVTTDDLTKVGNRKNKADAADIQDMHDKCMKLAGGLHCAAGDDPDMKDNDKQGKTDAKPGFTTEEAAKAASGDLEKKGARHSAADMAMIKAAHDAMCALGASCGKAADDADKTAKKDPPEDDADKGAKKDKAEGEDGA